MAKVFEVSLFSLWRVRDNLFITDVDWPKLPVESGHDCSETFGVGGSDGLEAYLEPDSLGDLNHVFATLFEAVQVIDRIDFVESSVLFARGLKIGGWSGKEKTVEC